MLNAFTGIPEKNGKSCFRAIRAKPGKNYNFAKNSS